MRIWVAAWKHIVGDRELLLVPILHFGAFLAIYLAPVGIVVGLLVLGILPEAIAIPLVLAAVVAGVWGGLASTEAMKVLVATSCRQRWAGSNPTLRTAWQEARQHQRHWMRGARPTDMRIVAVVHGTGPLPYPIAGPGPIFWVTVWFASSVTMGLLLGIAYLGATIVDPSLAGPTYAILALAAVGGILYVQGVGAILAAVLASAEHHRIQQGSPPPGFEVLDEPGPWSH